MLDKKLKNKLNGWIVVDKPLGITSTDVVNKIKRMIRPEKIGHAGTLDPFASGLLMIALGQATKLVEYTMDKHKGYEFEVTWGENRDTIDIEGMVIASSDKRPAIEDIKKILPSFLGVQGQIPPNYSAIRVNGRRAHEMARAKEDFVLPARNVRLDEIELLEFKMEKARFKIKCGRGFYVRSLARDIADKLGVCGFVSRLRRTHSGKFIAVDAISLEKIEEVMHTTPNDLEKIIFPTHAVLDDILVQAINEGEEKKLRNGLKIPLSIKANNEATIAAMQGENLVAMCLVKAQEIFPIKVFN